MLLLMSFIQCILYLAVLLTFSNAKIVELEESEVQEILDNLEIDPHRTPLFIEFYAPWCSTCKTMEKTINQLAEYVGEDAHVMIAKINAIKNKDKANHFNVTKYPTFVYVKGGHIGHYEGSRTLSALKEFVDKVKLPTYSTVERHEDVNEIARNMHFENVSFVLSLPCARLDSSCYADYHDILISFEYSALKCSMQAAFLVHLHQKKTTFCKVDTTVPDLLPLCLETLGTLQDKLKMSEFVSTHNYPLITHFENHNFHRLANMNTKMLVAVLDLTKHDSDVIMAGFQDAAKVYEREHPDMKFIMGILDGKKWHKFCKLHKVTLPTFLVLDHVTDEHAKFPIENVHSQQSVRIQSTEIIQSILEDKLVMEEVTHPSLYSKIVHRIERYMPWSLLLFAAPILLVLSTILYPQPGKAKSM